MDQNEAGRPPQPGAGVEIHRPRVCFRGRGEEGGESPDEGLPGQRRERPPVALGEELREERRGQDQRPRARAEWEREENSEGEPAGGPRSRGWASRCVNHALNDLNSADRAQPSGRAFFRRHIRQVAQSNRVEGLNDELLQQVTAWHS